MSKNKPKFVPVIFVPTSLRKPPKSGEYICVITHRSGYQYITTLNFVKKVGLFNVYVEPSTGEISKDTAIEVDYWADPRIVKDTLNLQLKQGGKTNA